MSDNLAIPKLFPLEQLVLHEIAKNVWEILVLHYSEEIFIFSNYLYKYNACYLKEYQNKVLKVLSELLPTEMFPALLKNKLVDALITVRLGYCEVFDYIYWNFELLTFFKISVVGDDQTIRNQLSSLFSVTSPDKSKCKTSFFINPLGHFDDLLWAKILVANENQPLKGRFYLACIYCCEKAIINLWLTGKANNQLYIEDDFEVIAPQDRRIIEMWICLLENDTDPAMWDNYDIDAFKAAFNGHREHAAKFFWNICPDDKKAIILSELDFDELALAAANNRVGFVHFIYSLLSVELKKDLVSFAIHNPKGAWIWGSMLCSYYYKTILTDILTFPFSVPLKFYELILDELVSKINKFCIPPYQEVLKILWNHLSQDERNEILSSSKIFAKNSLTMLF